MGWDDESKSSFATSVASPVATPPPSLSFALLVPFKCEPGVVSAEGFFV